MMLMAMFEKSRHLLTSYKGKARKKNTLNRCHFTGARLQRKAFTIKGDYILLVK